MPSLFDFNFTGDDPGPDTDPMLDNPDSQHDGEDDRANYEEPGRGLTFTGHDPTSFSGRGNAEEPTKQESDVPPIDMVALENEKSLAYWDKLWSDDESENETDEEFSQLQLGILYIVSALSYIASSTLKEAVMTLLVILSIPTDSIIVTRAYFLRTAL